MPKLARFVQFSSGVFALVLITLLRTYAAAADDPGDRPMNFILVSDGDCSDSCVQWVSAEGAITYATPTRFAAFLSTLKNRKLPIVIQSVGGDVDAALAIGQMIRNRKLDTAIGRTQLNDCPMLDPRCKEKMVKGGWSSGTVRSGGAYCFSTCPLVLAGGVNRAAAPNTSIGLHQITNGKKDRNYGPVNKRNLDAISTRKDDRIKEKLGTYLDAMGVQSKDVFAMMGLATPHGLYHVLDEEALKTGLITEVYSLEKEPGLAFTPEVPKTLAKKPKAKG